MKSEIEGRKGPHAIHQFVVAQAYGLIRKDPAYADGKSGLPSLEDVNAWDGNVRTAKGMKIRPRGTMTDRSLLAPHSERAYGPGADAEVLADDTYNREYRGAYHYWNPWLRIGEAPEGSAVYYGLLVKTIIDEHDYDARAHYASYMCHYIADVASAKHADAITFDIETLKKLQAIGIGWANESHESLDAWFESDNIAEALEVMQKATREQNAAASDAYWRRIRRFVGWQPLFKSGAYPTVDLATISLNSAVGAFLYALAHQEEGKDLEGFYNFFDPFYFNGPVFNKTGVGLNFQMATPFGTHLMWETNPVHGQIARDFLPQDPAAAIRPYTESGDPKPNYRTLHREESFYAPAFADALPGLNEAGKRFVMDCSTAAHGAITDVHDFEQNPQRHLRTAIQHVATALRASITALRLEATVSGKDDEGRVVIKCRIANVSDEPAQLKHVSVFLRNKNGTVNDRPLWTRAVSGNTVRSDKAHRMVIKCALPEDAGPEDLVVDVRAKFDKLPDLGWRRANVVERSLERVENPGADAVLNAKGGPTDVIIVLDTTSSMGGSIVNLTKNAFAAVAKLAERTEDLRVALVTFNDLEVEADKRKFSVHRFNTDYRVLESWFAGYGATGGGDVAEDQLHGISLALGLWEKEPVTTTRVPTKIIVTITDATAKSPDVKGNTFESIAKRAFNVDPAHIYPIVVGSSAAALADAKKLADLTDGEVLEATSGDEVADALLKAVSTAVETHGVPVDDGEGTPLYAALAFIVGVLASLFGAVTLVRSLASR